MQAHSRPLTGDDILRQASERPAVSLAPPAAVEQAFGRVANGVALVTLWEEGAPAGVLVSSLISLSVEPPRVLFNIPRDTGVHAALLRGDQCAATILSDQDRSEAARFAAGGGAHERFASPRWDLSDRFAPRFDGGLASFRLKIEQRIGAASHTIFIAAVSSVSSRPGLPLVSFERELAAITQV